MSRQLTNMRINRVSFVRRPANRRRFVLMKSEEGPVELAEGLEFHLGALLDILGLDDPERQEKIENLISIMDEGGDEAVNRLLAFLGSAQQLRALLADVVKAADSDRYDDDLDKDDDEPTDDDYSTWWREAQRAIQPVVRKEANDMDIRIDLGDGISLSAPADAQARTVLHDALKAQAGASDVAEGDLMAGYTMKLLKSSRTPEFRAIYRAWEWLTRRQSLSGWNPDVQEFSRAYGQRGFSEWA